MRKGRSLQIFSGIIEIIFGILSIALGVSMLFGSEISLAFWLPILSLASYLNFELSVLSYAILFIFFIIGIVFIVCGSVSISFMKKELGEYYKKKKSCVYFEISNILALAYMIAITVYCFSDMGQVLISSVSNSTLILIIPIVMLALSLLFCVLRFFGLAKYIKGSHEIPKSSEEEKNISKLGDYNTEGDLVSKLKHLNSMKELGEVSEKEYLDIKKKLLGE